MQLDTLVAVGREGNAIVYSIDKQETDERYDRLVCKDSTTSAAPQLFYVYTFLSYKIFERYEQLQALHWWLLEHNVRWNRSTLSTIKLERTCALSHLVQDRASRHWLGHRA